MIAFDLWEIVYLMYLQPSHGPRRALWLRVPLKPDSLNLKVSFTEHLNVCMAAIKGF